MAMDVDCELAERAIDGFALFAAVDFVPCGFADSALTALCDLQNCRFDV